MFISPGLIFGILRSLRISLEPTFEIWILKFSESISGGNNDDPAKFRKLQCLEDELSKIDLFQILACNLHTRQVVSNFVSEFMRSY